jgi:hypothetical protein
MSALLLVLLASVTSSQMDLSCGATEPGSSKTELHGAMYVGMWSTSAWPAGQTHGSFSGAGLETTLHGRTAPYQSSVGFGPRLGYVWGRREGSPAPLPAGYLYARVTPFVGLRTAGDDPSTNGVSGGGFRVGIGVTSPGWSLALTNGMDRLVDMTRVRAPVIALFIVGGLLAFVDHVEVTWELFLDGEREEARWGLRFGTGF